MRKSSPNHTAQISREQLKRDASDVLKSARERAGMSAAHLAADLGQSETWVYTREDRDKLSAPAPLDTAMHPALLPHVAHMLAARAGLVVFTPPALDGAPQSDLAHLAAVSRETSEAVCAYATAIGDGHVTRSERDECRREIHEAIVALLRLDAALEAQADEPVVGVVRELPRRGA